MTNIYRLSDFCHFIKVDTHVTALYNSLTLGLIFISSAMAEKLISTIGGIVDVNSIGLTRELLKELMDRRLIFPLGERADLVDYTKAHNILRKNGIAIIYLLATDGCNLGCRYCYIENALPEDYSFSLMTEETAREALQLFAGNVSPMIDEPRIILYGGEPLLNMPVVYCVVSRFNEMKREGALSERCGLTINTNATLVTREFLKNISGKGVQIAVSLDGKKEMHDSMRPQRDGGGTYDQVVANCKMMAEHDVEFGFSVTITKANIFELEEVLLDLHDQFKIKSVGFNIAIHQSSEIIGMSQDEYAHLVTEKLISCFKICREKGIYEDRIMRKVDAFIKGYPYIYDCGAPGDQLVVTPDRYVGVCQAYCGDKRNFVRLEELGKLEENPIWENWRYRSPLYQKQCYNCISLGICGGCPYNAELKTGSIWGG